MRLDFRDREALVTLSKRNLLALIGNVGGALSVRVLTGGYVYRDGALVDDTLLIVRCETESDCTEREPPGQLQLATEFFVAQLDGSEGNAN
jgi:hypothetical protein